jgi:hypothetical protein
MDNDDNDRDPDETPRLTDLEQMAISAWGQEVKEFKEKNDFVEGPPMSRQRHFPDLHITGPLQSAPLPVESSWWSEHWRKVIIIGILVAVLGLLTGLLLLGVS